MTVTTLQPDATAGIDNFITQTAANQNNGTRVEISCGDVAAGTSHRRLLIKFDLSSITAGSTINSATLYMTCTSESSSTNFDIGIHRSLVVWYEGNQSAGTPTGEDASVWNYRNHTGSVAWTGGAGGVSGTEWAASATATTTITQAANTEFSWDVTADLTYWITNGNTNLGWWAISVGEGSTNSMKTFAASDNATASYRPRISVDWTAPSAGNPYYAYAQQ